MKTPTVKSLAIGILLISIGFLGGTQYQASRPSNRNLEFRDQMFHGLRNGTGSSSSGGSISMNRGMGQIIGEILSKDENSITVKLLDGGSKIILLGNKTSINKAELGSTTDLVIGTKVGIFGITNSDGSVTAQNIQINPSQRGPNNIEPTSENK